MNKLKKDTNGILYVDVYHPYRLEDGKKNPAFNSFGGKVLDLKDKKPQAISYFYNILNKCIPHDSNVSIVVVPSHDPAKNESGILSLARKLSPKTVDVASCLVRTKKINKLAAGGTRSVRVHLRTIKLQNAHMIEGKHIILLDDVTTTGNSLLACKQILQKAGPKEITMIAIGKTQR